MFSIVSKYGKKLDCLQQSSQNNSKQSTACIDLQHLCRIRHQYHSITPAERQRERRINCEIQHRLQSEIIYVSIMRLRSFWFLTSVVLFATMRSTLSSGQEVQDCSDNPTPQPSIKPSYAPSNPPSYCDASSLVPSKPNGENEGEGGSKPSKMPSSGRTYLPSLLSNPTHIYCDTPAPTASPTLHYSCDTPVPTCSISTTSKPSIPTSTPAPTTKLSLTPTSMPTIMPQLSPVDIKVPPSVVFVIPTALPTAALIAKPTFVPSATPSKGPISEPTATPTLIVAPKHLRSALSTA